MSITFLSEKGDTTSDHDARNKFVLQRSDDSDKSAKTKRCECSPYPISK